MTGNFKRAIQPDHPCAPRVGHAIAPPPCERGIPIYPVRYGIADQPLDREIFQTLSVNHYPPLQTAKPYGLRLLRPGSYLYLFYFQHGRMKTRHYQVTEDVRFAHLWWTPDDYNSDVYHVQAPETRIADTVYLMVSEVLLSHATLWRIEQDEGGLRSQLATTVQPAELPMQSHVFDSAYAGNALAELKATGTSGIFPTFAGPSKRPDFMARYGQALNNLVRQLGPRPGVSPLAVALHDPIGVVSELHHLVTLAVEKKTRYAGQHAHRLQSANFISGYFKAANEQAKTNTETAEALKRQRKLLDYDGAMRFPDLYAKELAILDNAVAEQVKDVVAWVQLIGPEQLLGKALGLFDLQIKAVADAYEETVFDCMGGLVHSDEGRQRLHEVVMMPTDRSPFWLAIGNGSKLLAERFKEKTVDLVKGALAVVDNYLSEHAGTPATNALMGMLQALPSAHKADVLILRLRAVVEVRFSATIIMQEIGLSEFIQQSRNLKNHYTHIDDYINTWKSPQPKVAHISLNAKFYIYEIIHSGYTTYHKEPTYNTTSSPPQVDQNSNNLYSNIKNGLQSGLGLTLAGLGGYLAVTNFTNSIKKAKHDTDIIFNYGDMAGASLTLLGASIEAGLTTTSIPFALSGRTATANSLKYLAAKYGAATFGAGGAAISSIAEGLRGIRSLRECNTDQALMYLGSAVSGGIVALATWGGGSAAAASLMAGATVAVLGITPLGWTIIAITALGATIAFIVGTDTTKHGPVEIWLKHSAWGIHHNRYTKQEELSTVYSLYYHPRLSAEWHQTPGFRVGTLNIKLALPTARNDNKESFQTRLVVRKHTQKLQQVIGPLVHSTNKRTFDYEREYLITPTFAYGKESGWNIQMHQSATVELEYLYTPDTAHPEVYFTQTGAPSPLKFRAADLFSTPIDPTKLDPIRAPE